MDQKSCRKFVKRLTTKAKKEDRLETQIYDVSCLSCNENVATVALVHEKYSGGDMLLAMPCPKCGKLD